MCMFMCVYIYICVCVCICVCITYKLYTCVYIDMCMCVCVRIYVSCRKNLVTKMLSSCNTDLSRNSFNFILQTSRRVYPMQNFEPDPFLRSRRPQNDQNRPKNQFFNKKSIFVEVGPYTHTQAWSQPRPRPRPIQANFPSIFLKFTSGFSVFLWILTWPGPKFWLKELFSILDFHIVLLLAG